MFPQSSKSKRSIVAHEPVQMLYAYIYWILVFLVRSLSYWIAICLVINLLKIVTNQTVTVYSEFLMHFKRLLMAIFSISQNTLHLIAYVIIDCGNRKKRDTFFMCRRPLKYTEHFVLMQHCKFCVFLNVLSFYCHCSKQVKINKDICEEKKVIENGSCND